MVNWLKEKIRNRNRRIDIPNEAVNLEKRCVFVAIPKTGTTSVREQIRLPGRPLVAAPHLDVIQIRQALDFFLLLKALGRNHEFPSSGVLDNREITEQSDRLWGSAFKFAAVRNPWARAVSLYFRREGVSVRSQMSFEEFCEKHAYASDTCVYPTRHLNQVDWLIGKDGRIAVDYVYKIEKYSDAIRAIADLTDGRVELKVRKSNVNPQSKSTRYRDLYNDRTRKIIRKRFEKDIDIFEYSF